MSSIAIFSLRFRFKLIRISAMSVRSDRGSRRVTQKDVAVRAGVSQATVSIVLTGAASPPVPAPTLARVEQAARDLGYVPNRAAQALRTRRTMTLACVIPDIANPFYPPFMRGLQQIAEDEAYDVIGINTDGSEEREQRFLRWARQGHVDGVAGIFFTLRARSFEPLIQAGIAVVRIETAAKTNGPLPIDNLCVDNARASREVVRYLLDRGHRRIAMISGRGGPQATRVQGYATAMRDAGVPVRIVLDDLFGEEDGYRATTRLLADGGRPTAIFAVNDLMAIGAMAALREAGLDIPADVAVAGFDDIPAARLVTPSLTTVTQFQDDLGREAARTLVARLRGRGSAPEGTSREMPFRLVERRST